MDGCVFCKIISKDLPSEKIYETDNVYAFLDGKPINRGHTLVIPKKHSTDIFDIPEDELTELMSVAKKISGAALKSLKADGINIGMNNKAAAGQAVMHAHLHIIPRFESDGLKHWPGKDYAADELKLDAAAIKKEL